MWLLVVVCTNRFANWGVATGAAVKVEVVRWHCNAGVDVSSGSAVVRGCRAVVLCELGWTWGTVRGCRVVVL